MTRGKPIDLKRHRQIAKLRAAGMTYQAIADQLGVSFQAVHEALWRSGQTRTVPIPCRECNTVIARMRMVANNNEPAYCMNCLPPTATFGQRLKARRLTSGLTINALGKQTGIHASMLSNLEQGGHDPMWKTLVKLIRVFGVDWLDVR